MKQDVSAYYDQTQNHYKRWWKLDKTMALHYGLWYDNTRSFKEALKNTNKYMAEAAGVTKNSRILDAGCGVGGAAIYLAKTFAANTLGLTLSPIQVETARSNAVKHDVDKLVEFKQDDFTNTGLADASFDVIWACESSSSAPDKDKMLSEWHRLLKPGGKLILLDFFRSSDTNVGPHKLLDQWCELWAMSPLVSVGDFKSALVKNDFTIITQENLTSRVLPTINWMYKTYLLGSLPSMLYNLIFNSRKYSKNHYKSGLYQYRAYKNGLWEYQSFLAEKSDLKQYFS